MAAVTPDAPQQRTVSVAELMQDPSTAQRREEIALEQATEPDRMPFSDIPMSTGEQRMVAMYDAYFKGIDDPEGSGISVREGDGLTVFSGAGLKVFRGESLFGTQGPKRMLDGFLVTDNMALPITSSDGKMSKMVQRNTTRMLDRMRQ